MATRKRVEKRVQYGPTPVFEIAVILAIVVIVAVTGQVLISYEKAGQASSFASGSSGMTGFAVSEQTASQDASTSSFTDVGITQVTVDPESPLIGEPITVTATIKNQGNADITTPFYIEFKFVPRNDETGSLQPMTVNTIMTKPLKAGESSDVSVHVTTIMPEGTLMIIASADSTAKLDDKNPANNQMSSTIVVAAS